MKAPIRIYTKTGWTEPFERDRLHLFRMRKAGDSAKHVREDLFHVTASQREKISTCRYSIAGYPSLYLTTSIELGLKEIGDRTRNVIVSLYKVKRNQQKEKIKVLELGIRPTDFSGNKNNRFKDFDEVDLKNKDVRSSYLLWYPLIAVCSFIRAYKDKPFASEYIVPQMFMQWVRKQAKRDELTGIRYFSCASILAADVGFDYVFPVNNTNYQGKYCSILRDSFLLTDPIFLCDYPSIDCAEQELVKCEKLETI